MSVPGYYSSLLPILRDTIHGMNFLDLVLPTLEENLALDEVLLLHAEGGCGSEVLRVWEWSAPAVVLGAGCRFAQEVAEAACQADGVSIFRRASGGGTVLLGQGCLCYSLVLDYERSPALREIRSSFAYILDQLRDSLANLAPRIECAGISDLAATDKKFSGNSQQRKRHFLLHHGTILYDFDLALIDRYLPMPSRQPGYRRQRGHLDFLVNLPAKPAQLIMRLKAAWGAERKLPDWPREMVRELVENKYSRSEWTHRR